MNRKRWLIYLMLGAGVLVAFIAMAFPFRGFWRHAGGPVMIVRGGDAPNHGFLGVHFKAENATPLTVNTVLPGSGADRAGLQPGDVIVAAGPKQEPDFAALQRLLQASVPGDEMCLRIRRGAEEIELRVKLIGFGEMIERQERALAEKRMDPAKLPEPLRPFLPLFEKWGDVRSDTTRYALMDGALNNPDEMRELREWHAKLSHADLSSCEKWMDGPISPLHENYERAKVHFTYLLLYGELEIDKR